MTPAKTETAEFYTPPEHGWVCFHCGETFMHEVSAREHFGGSIDAIPGCRLRMRAGERSLLRRIRWLERQYKTLRDRVASEDTDKDREIYAMQAAHTQALIREEEKGYARGLRDAKAEAGE